MANFRVEVRFNQVSLGSAVNTFQYEAPFVVGMEQEMLDAVEDWIEAIYDPLLSMMSELYVFASARVVRLASDGSVAEIIGAIAPTISGENSTDQLASPTAASTFARTNNAKIRGAKRFGGLTEDIQQDGLFDNALVAALVQALIAWILGPGVFGLSDAFAGVFSTTLLEFARFNGQGAATNIPGTQVTRKPLRGS